MRYRGFIITACFDSGIERYNRETGKDELCKGYYCQVYAGNDDMYDEQIDDFCLAAGHEIEDLSDAALTKGIREYVDGMHHELEEGMNFNKKAIAYLSSAAEHGNQYAEQLLHSIQSNRNWSAAMGAIRLLHHLSRMIQNQLDDEKKGKAGAIDRKLKRKIDEKKQAHGLKQG